MDDAQPGDLPAPNLTRAGITGKVPDWARPKPARGRRGKVKLSKSGRKHVSHLQKAGHISARAAAQTGLK